MTEKTEHTEHTEPITAPVPTAAAEEAAVPPDTAAAAVTPMEPVDDPETEEPDGAEGTAEEPGRFSAVRVRGFLKSLGMGALFVLVLLLVLYSAARIFEPKNNGGVGGLNAAHMAAEGFLGEPADTLDVLFLGDSETYSAISPVEIWKETGVASYTCAIGGQYLTYSKSLMEKALARHHPKLVVVEANQLFRAFDEQRLIKSAVKDLFPIFERHDRWKALTARDFVAEPENTWIDDMKGFRLKWGMRPADASAYMEPTDNVAEVPDLTEKVLASMAEECRAYGAQLVIVATPSTKNWYSSRHNGIEALAAKLGIDFIDLNTGDDQVAIDWNTDTRDYGDHLNYYGATKVSQALGQLLRDRYGLPDHRGEAGYETWQRAVRHYDRAVESGKRWTETCLAPLTRDLRATLPLMGRQLP